MSSTLFVYRWERVDGNSLWSNTKPTAEDKDRYCFITIKSALAYICSRGTVNYDSGSKIHPDLVLCRYEADRASLQAEIERPGWTGAMSFCNSIADYCNQFVANVVTDSREVLSYMSCDDVTAIQNYVHKNARSRKAFAEFAGISKKELDIDMVSVHQTPEKPIYRVPFNF